MRRLGLVAIVVCAVSMTTGAGVAAAPSLLPADEALSTNIQALVNNGMIDGPYLRVAGDSGWNGARGDAFWYRIEATKGTYDWSYYDGVKAALDAQGIRWQPILDGSPNWAHSSGGTLTPADEAHYPDYARFAAAFAARYGPGGPKAGSKPVTDMEIYNEENILWSRPASSYAALYQQARAAIQAVQPDIRVVVGAVLYDSSPPTDADWIKAFFSALNGSGADAIGVHPYAPTAIGQVSTLRRIHQGLVDAGQGSLPVYVSELGYPAALDGATPAAHAVDGPTTDESRAGTVTLLTDGLLASDCGVRNIAYFDLVNQEYRHADSDYAASESWKGVERKADGSLTVTGKAFRDSGERWRANPVPGTVHMCGATAGAGTAPMPLALKVSRPSALCFNETVTYRGFPIGEASIVVSKPGGGSSSLLTNAAGSLDKDFCVSEKNVAFTVQAEVSYAPASVPRFAQSVAYSCPANSTASCTLIAGSGPPGGGGAGGTGTSGADGGSSGAGGAKCLLRSLKVSGSRRLRSVLKHGLRLRAGGCGTKGDAAIQTRIAATVARSTARRLKLVHQTPKKPFKVAAGTKRVTAAGSSTIVVRFTKKLRARLRHAKQVKLTLVVTLVQGSTRATLTRRVTLVR